MAHKYTIEFDEDTWQALLRHAGRGNIKDYITHLLDREFSAARTPAIILAGGESSDLYPTKIPIPKAMLPVGYRPVVEYLLEHVVDHGITQVSLVASAKGNVRDHFANIATPGVDLSILTEAEPQGTAGALRVVRHQIKGTFLVLNGDLLTNVNLTDLLREHRASGAAATVLATHPDHRDEHDPNRLDRVDIDEDGTVRGIRADGELDAGKPVHFNAGIYVLEASVLDLIPEEGFVSLEVDVLPRLIAERKVRAHVMHESTYWRDVADPDEFARSWEDMLTGRFTGST